VSVAWIIAIEKYADKNLRINPVGSSALDFAELMLESRIAKVVLSTSLRPDAYTERLSNLEARGVIRKGAALADFLEALDEIRGTETLLLYWLGHGIMARSRKLLSADSTVSDLRAISVDSLLAKLRAPEYPRLQIGFFESCAQVVTTDPVTLDLGQGSNTPTRQFFYYAASAGETAAGVTEAKSFSGQVLDALKRSPKLPPDSPLEFFDALRISLGKMPLRSRPFLQRTDESGDIWSSGDPGTSGDLDEAGRLAGLSESQFSFLWLPIRTMKAKPVELARAYRGQKLPQFIEELRTLDPLKAAPELLEKAIRQLKLELEFEPLCLRLRLLFADWLALYSRVLEEDLMGEPERAEDLPRLLLNVLDQRNEESGVRSFLKLLELAARHARQRQPQASVALAHALVDHPRLQHPYRELLEQMPTPVNSLFLLLAIEWDPRTSSSSLIDAWIHSSAHKGFDPRDVPRGKPLAEQINAVIERAIQQFPEHVFRFELLLPNDLLCMPRNLLEFIDPDLGTCTWLEAEHPISVRWHDRMKGDERFRPGTWRASYNKLKDSIGDPLSCEWRPGDPSQGGSGDFVALSFPGPSPSDPARNRTQFFSELLKGKPYMCWPRNQAQDVPQFKEAVRTLLATAQIMRLPQQLSERRAEPLLEDLILLMDEAHRNPYNDSEHLTDTPQRGTDD